MPMAQRGLPDGKGRHLMQPTAGFCPMVQMSRLKARQDGVVGCIGRSKQRHAQANHKTHTLTSQPVNQSTNHPINLSTKSTKFVLPKNSNMTKTASQPLTSILEIPTFTLVTIPAGSFVMGSKADSDSQPLTEITFASDFYMGRYPVTQELWQAVMHDNPAFFKGSKRPVEQVSWDDICNKGGFLDQLNELATIKDLLALAPYKGMRFALPSEAQWEYAARGGPAGPQAGYEFAGSNHIDEVAWYEANSHNETKPVGLKAANQLGLHDMSGNVWEWCADDWLSDYTAMPTDGRPRISEPERARHRVIRGGSSFGNEQSCRAAYRSSGWPDFSDHDIGFRLVLSPSLVGGL
jgi:formylglycine-generating enzyme